MCIYDINKRKQWQRLAHVGRWFTESLLWASTDLHNTLTDWRVDGNISFPADRWQTTCVPINLTVSVSVYVSFPLTSIILIEGVHAGEVDGEGLEGRRQADAALRSLHVQARRRARVGRLGQARLGILHAEYGSRRLGWLSAAPEADPPHPEKRRVEQEPPRCTHRRKSVQQLTFSKWQQERCFVCVC